MFFVCIFPSAHQPKREKNRKHQTIEYSWVCMTDDSLDRQSYQSLKLLQKQTNQLLPDAMQVL